MTQTVPDSVEEFSAALRAAGPEEVLRMLSTATPAEARAAMNILGLPELYALPRELVEAWEPDADTPGSARYIRATRLRTETWVPEPVTTDNLDQLWLIRDIAAAVNVRPDSVSRWRTNWINGEGPWTQQLCRHTHGIGRPKDKGERLGERGGSGTPLWQPNVALDDMVRKGKLTSDLYPHDRDRGGSIPPGRPPKQRGGE